MSHDGLPKPYRLKVLLLRGTEKNMQRHIVELRLRSMDYFSIYLYAHGEMCKKMYITCAILSV
ncbi:hypothetical protein ADJ74_09445 [Selenomonas sp. oral taxon 478]|nr:hypothetical protein ADJ74_09445 [Selenomonas sp. oral taxon 478]